MAIYVAVRPNPVAWSKNFMRLELYYDNFNSGWQMQIQLLNDATQEVISEVVYPTTGSSGSVEVRDLDELIDFDLSGGIEYSTASTIYEITQHYVDVKVRFRPFASGQRYSWTYDTDTFRVIKGGIESLYSGNTLNVNHGGYDRTRFCPNNGSRILSYVPSGRSMTKDESGWLTYFHDLPNQPECRYTVYYMDGTSTDIDRPMPDSLNFMADFKYRMWSIPVGIEQAALDPTNKGVYRYVINVRDSVVGNSLAYYEINVDQMPYYNVQTLIYRNSFYALDSIQLRGLNVLGGGSAERRTQALYKGTSIAGTQPVYYSKSRIEFSGNTGYISKQHKAALIELANTTYCAIVLNNVFIPMRMKSEELPAVSNRDNLHSYKVEFETTDEFERMPKEIQSLI